MKLKLTTALLLAVLAIPHVHADEPARAAQAAQQNQAAEPQQAVADALFPSSAPKASSPSAEPAATNSVRPGSKSARTSTASAPARKVATDYAPAQDLLLSAMSLIGVKYKWGGETPESGLDCSGFIKYVFQNTLNIALPRTALGMSRIGDDIDKGELKPGDLVFFNTLKREFSHVGIYLGDNRFIHAPRKGKNVEISNMTDRYWTARYNGARRVSELDHENIDIAALLENRPARIASAKPGTAAVKPKASTSKVKTAAAKSAKQPAKATAQKKTATKKAPAKAQPRKKAS